VPILLWCLWLSPQPVGLWLLDRIKKVQANKVEAEKLVMAKRKEAGTQPHTYSGGFLGFLS
jgi:hypothetical protein